MQTPQRKILGANANRKLSRNTAIKMDYVRHEGHRRVNYVGAPPPSFVTQMARPQSVPMPQTQQQFSAAKGAGAPYNAVPIYQSNVPPVNVNNHPATHYTMGGSSTHVTATNAYFNASANYGGTNSSVAAYMANAPNHAGPNVYFNQNSTPSASITANHPPPGFAALSMSPNHNGPGNNNPRMNMPPTPYGANNMSAAYLLSTQTGFSAANTNVNFATTNYVNGSSMSYSNANNSAYGYSNSLLAYYNNLNGNANAPNIWNNPTNANAAIMWNSPSANNNNTKNAVAIRAVTSGTQTDENKNTNSSIGIQCMLTDFDVDILMFQNTELKATKMSSRYEDLLQDIDNNMNAFLSASTPSSPTKSNTTSPHNEENNNSDDFGDGVYISRAQYNNFIRLAQFGSDVAEKVASAHRNRPCFKKIDSLCARLRQDLQRQDSVLPNINSQGVAWAVKDFIFVFTRIMNAWIILKGYVYNNQEGLSRVRSCLTPLFIEYFVRWQDITFTFITHILKSFVKLDNLVQTQKNGFHKQDPNTTEVRANNTDNFSNNAGGLLINETVADILDVENVLNKNYLFTNVAEDMEVTQREAEVNGTYFRTGTYKPMKKGDVVPVETSTMIRTDVSAQPPSLCPTTTATSSSSTTSTQISLANSALQLPIPIMPFSVTSNIGLLPAQPPPITYNNCSNNLIDPKARPFLNLYNSPPHVYNDLVSNVLTNALSDNTIANAAATNNNFCHQNVMPYFEPYLRTFLENYYAIERNVQRSSKIQIMGERLMELNAAEYFYRYHRINDLFPDFFVKHCKEFDDLFTIISKIHTGNVYIDVFQIVNHAKRVIFVADEYLKNNTNQFLEKSIRSYEVELNKSISNAPFERARLDKIIGSPKEEEIFNAVYKKEMQNIITPKAD